MRIQVKDIMSHPVVTATKKTKVRDLMEIMNRKKLHAIPIVTYEKQLPLPKITIQGIVSSSDLIGLSDLDTLAESIMTPNIHIIHTNTSAKSAAKMMIKRNVHHLVAMEDGQISGMISSMDFVRLVAED